MNTRELNSLLNDLPPVVPVLDADYNVIKHEAPKASIRDGRLIISSEFGNNHYILDYYGDYNGGSSYIDRTLEKWAEERGLYWEWYNPAFIYLAD